MSSNAAPLTPVGDLESQGNYVQVQDEAPERIEERIVQEDGTVLIKVTMRTKKKKAVQTTPATQTTTTTSTSNAGDATQNTTAGEPTQSTEKTADAGESSEGVKHVSIPIQINDSTHELPDGVITTGKWETSLFSCFDHCVPNCCMVTFCPCVSAAQIASRIGFSFWTVLGIFAAAICVEYLFWGLAGAVPALSSISTVVAICVFIAFWQLRTKVRAKYEIPGSPIEDCLISWCCSCCSLAQMATHVKSYKKGSCDFGPPNELCAYEH